MQTLQRYFTPLLIGVIGIAALFWLTPLIGIVFLVVAVVYALFFAEDGWDDDLLALAVVTVITVVLLLVGAYAKPHDRTVDVISKERVCSTDSCEYLVYTDTGTFKLADSYVHWRFNTSDVYGKVKECTRYDITYYGYRFGFTSDYPNIISLNEVGAVDGCK